MQYGDPRDARRAARDARRAAHRYARDMRRMNRYRYGGPASGFGVAFLIFLGVYLLTHAWVWLLIGFVVIIVLSTMWRRSNQSWYNPWQNGYQQSQPQQSEAPPQPYQSPRDAEQFYQDYERGYQPAPHETYEEGGSRYQYPPQAQAPDYQRYEGPQTQYPEQMPPMQQ